VRITSRIPQVVDHCAVILYIAEKY